MSAMRHRIIDSKNTEKGSSSERKYQKNDPLSPSKSSMSSSCLRGYLVQRFVSDDFQSILVLCPLSALHKRVGWQPTFELKSDESNSLISLEIDPSAGAASVPSGRLYFLDRVVLVKYGFSLKC